MKKILFLKQFLGAICMFLSFITASMTAGAADRYVAMSGNDGGTGTFGDPWLTIQHAVVTSISGDVIHVAAGVYVEVGQIVINKNLTIIGDDKSTTIIKPDANTASGAAWILVDPGISFDLSKVTLDGTGKLIYWGVKHQGNGTIDDCNITQIRFNESGPEYEGTAVAINSTGTVDVTNCTFTEIGRNGILADQCLGTYSGNTYTGKGIGNWLDYFILSEYGDIVTISNNTISDCKGVASTDGSTSCGIAVWDDPGTQAIITGNTLTNNSAGVVIVGYSGGTDPKVTIGAGNLFDGGDYGVTFETFPSVSFTPDVTFTGVSTFKGQTIQSIKLYDGASAGTIIDISSEVFKTAGGVTITDNFAIEDLVYHAIDATNRGLLVWNSPNVYVTPNSGSIQRAVNAALSSWTVKVAAGTYTESVIIDKTLTLKGANAGVDPCTGSRSAETIITGTNTSGLINVAANDVVIDGIKLVPVGTGASGTYGILIQGSETNLEVKNVLIDGVSSDRDGINLWKGTLAHLHNNKIINAVYGIGGGSDDASSPTSAIIEDNCISNTRLGITGYHDGSTIRRNIVKDFTLAPPAAGISGQLLNTSISENTVTNYLYGAGIAFAPYAPRPNSAVTTITNNFVNANGAGIYIYAGQTLGGVEAHFNDLSGNIGYNIQNLSGNTFNATCNWYGTIISASIALKISGLVDYTPYLTNGTDNAPGTKGFQPVPNSCNGYQYVDCGKKNDKKVIVCHNGKSQCISVNALQAHLNHGDLLGPCPSANRGNPETAIVYAEDFKLFAAPNPVHTFTTIRYELPQDSKVNITLYDPMGRVVSTLVDASRTAGSYNYTLDASRLAAGLYFYKMTAVSGSEKFVQSQKLLIVK